MSATELHAADTAHLFPRPPEVTADLIHQLRQSLAAATPGPWGHDGRKPTATVWGGPDGDEVATCWCPRLTDAILVAQAVTALPWLLDEIARLRRQAAA